MCGKKYRVLQVSMKKTKHLKLSVKKTKHLKLSVKKPKHLELSYFLWVLQKHRKFLSLFHFSKNLAMLSFVLLSRLQANHCWMYKTMTMFIKNTNTLNYQISIWYLQSEKNRVPEESDSSRCLDFFTDTCKICHKCN
jgi:hypothetical protein